MLMVKTKQKSKYIKRKVPKEEDSSVYFLKLVVFLILGSQWIYIENLPEWQVPIPIGLILGLIIASHEHFQIDRKIEYAILLIASFISFWLPLGLVIKV
jgi:hypothetical protein